MKSPVEVRDSEFWRLEPIPTGEFQKQTTVGGRTSLDSTFYKYPSWILPRVGGDYGGTVIYLRYIFRGSGGDFTETLEKAPAKLNLSLDTPFHHHDGSEEWDMVLTSVDLADYVAVKTLGRNGRIKVTTDSGFLPNDHRNLAYQAAHLLATTYGRKEAMNIHIEKHIPVAAGMGGGSSDAAAVLRALNRLWELNLDQATLCQLGLQIDADVPYCVCSQTAHVTGRGEIITQLPKLPPMWVVIAKPKISVSTPSILRRINYAEVQHADTHALVAAIQRGDYDEICDSVENVLTPITSRLYPTVNHLKEQMVRFGADVAEMSGTGPTVFGICRKQSRAQHVANGLSGFCREVHVVRPVSLHTDFAQPSASV